MWTKHSKNGEVSESFNCSQRKKIFTQKNNLISHIKYMHQITEKNNHCDFGKFLQVNSLALYKHIFTKF